MQRDLRRMIAEPSMDSILRRLVEICEREKVMAQARAPEIERYAVVGAVTSARTGTAVRPAPALGWTPICRTGSATGSNQAGGKQKLATSCAWTGVPDSYVKSRN
jgi:hypothetical protein